MRTTKPSTLNDIISQELNPNRLICPICGYRVVIPTTKAGKTYGVCEVCYTRAQEAATRYEASLIASKKSYDAARQEKSNLAKKTLRKEQQKRKPKRRSDFSDFMGI